MNWFTGRYERQLDSKNRLAVPSELRRHFGDSCFLAFGRTGCVDVFTPERFQEMANELMEREKRGEITYDAVRTFAAHTYRQAFDGQGRVTLDPSLREFAGLTAGRRLVVAGALDRLEIWDAEAFDTVEARGAAALRDA